MLVLFILLGTLFIGICGFLAQNCDQLQSTIKKTDLTRITPSRSQLTEALDELLKLYQGGGLTEEQYLSAADKLIDQLVVDVKSETPLHQRVSFSTNDAAVCSTK